MATFTVYEDLAQEVSKRLERLSKKAAKYEIPFFYEMGEEHPETVRVLGVGPDGVASVMSSHTVAAVDFAVECEGLIKANGWTVCAKIEHGEQGNIVTGFDGHEVLPEWYTVAPNCDHCHVNRPRSVTFVCKNESGEYRQVGRTCLKEYTGIAPAMAAIWAEVQDMLDTGMDCAADEWGSREATKMYSVADILGHAYDLIEKFGYRKSEERMSTKEQTVERLLAGSSPSDEGMVHARELISWLSGLDEVAKAEDRLRREAWEEAEACADEYGAPATVRRTPNTVGDVERNCIPLALSGYAKLSHVGRLAYIPVAYQRHLERMEREAAKEEARQSAAETSEYVGSVGERLAIKIAEATLLTSWDGYYGTTWLYKFKDESGNEFIWYASRPCEAEGGATIKATVKDHKERDGVKQTILTRCQVAA